MASSEGGAVQLLRDQLKGALRLLEGTIEGVTAEQAYWVPPGSANPIGANYAHVVLGQDGAINRMLKLGAPLFATSWAGRVGVSELPPAPDPKKPGFPDWSAWARRVKIDLADLRKYAQAVYAATDAYLATLSDQDLSRPAEVAALGIPSMTVGQLLSFGVLGNALMHCGEISCLKGQQGTRGYPI